MNGNIDKLKRSPRVDNQLFLTSNNFYGDIDKFVKKSLGQLLIPKKSEHIVTTKTPATVSRTIKQDPYQPRIVEEIVGVRKIKKIFNPCIVPILFQVRKGSGSAFISNNNLHTGTSGQILYASATLEYNDSVFKAADCTVKRQGSGSHTARKYTRKTGNHIITGFDGLPSSTFTKTCDDAGCEEYDYDFCPQGPTTTGKLDVLNIEGRISYCNSGDTQTGIGSCVSGAQCKIIENLQCSETSRTWVIKRLGELNNFEYETYTEKINLSNGYTREDPESWARANYKSSTIDYRSKFPFDFVSEVNSLAYSTTSAFNSFGGFTSDSVLLSSSVTIEGASSYRLIVPAVRSGEDTFAPSPTGYLKVWLERILYIRFFDSTGPVYEYISEKFTKVIKDTKPKSTVLLGPDWDPDSGLGAYYPSDDIPLRDHLNGPLVTPSVQFEKAVWINVIGYTTDEYYEGDDPPQQ
jgi:hypothetical protein